VELSRAHVNRAHKAVWIDFDQILWCESAGSGTKIHFTDGQDLTVEQNPDEIGVIFRNARQ
jgi:DNA-binding LytR/AlgR family response regulator